MLVLALEGAADAFAFLLVAPVVVLTLDVVSAPGDAAVVVSVLLLAAVLFVVVATPSSFVFLVLAAFVAVPFVFVGILAAVVSVAAPAVALRRPDGPRINRSDHSPPHAACARQP